MQLSDYLRIPYLLEARLAESSPGVWISRLSYPELPDCKAESPSLVGAEAAVHRGRDCPCCIGW